MLNRYTLPLLSALVVSASLASCQRKEVVSVPELPPAGEIGFTVSDSDAETKSTPLEANYFGRNHNPFNVVVYKHAKGAATSDWDLLSGTQICAYEPSSTGFWRPNRPIAWPMTEEKLTFIAYAPSTLPSPTTSSGNRYFARGEVPFLKDFTVESNVKNQVDILLAVEESSASPLVGNLNVGLTFHHALTFVKFSINENITSCSSITLEGIPGTGTLDMSTGEWSSVCDTVSYSYTITSPTFGDADAANGQCLIDEKFTLMLIPQTLPEGATLRAETSAGTITASLAGQVWEPGKVVTYKLTDPIFPFSVSPTQKVRFSPGNLQADFADAGSTFTWKFADNQWDYVGGDDGSGTVTETGNNFIDGNGSVSAVGTVDLFGWSTGATKYGIHNSTYNFSYLGDFMDWGSDPRLVSTLGSGWRTLSRAEWTYLLNTRGGGSSDYPRYCKATVNDVPGLVIFPDDYSHPSGVTALANVNTSDADFDTNSWDGDDWTAMESAGCVFLPAASTRNGTSFVNGGMAYGAYWSSSTGYVADSAWAVIFSPYLMSITGSDKRRFGHFVRLVQDL